MYEFMCNFNNGFGNFIIGIKEFLNSPFMCELAKFVSIILLLIIIGFVLFLMIFSIVLRIKGLIDENEIEKTLEEEERKAEVKLND